MYWARNLSISSRHDESRKKVDRLVSNDDAEDVAGPCDFLPERARHLLFLGTASAVGGLSYLAMSTKGLEILLFLLLSPSVKSCRATV